MAKQSIPHPVRGVAKSTYEFFLRTGNGMQTFGEYCGFVHLDENAVIVHRGAQEWIVPIGKTWG